MTEQSKLADEKDDGNDDENGNENSEVIRGTEVIENGRNIMPMANDVKNRTFGNSACDVAETNKSVLHDLESICRSELNDTENESVEDSDTRFPLPNRSICNPHTLSLIGKTDLFNALLDEDFANQYFDTFERVNQLWNAANKSNKNVQIVIQWIGKKIRKPHRLRWNRIFEAVCSFQMI